MSSSQPVSRPAAAYFALVFGAGFVLGSIRVPFLVPQLGERTAELLEAPLMWAVMFFASRYVTRRFGLDVKRSILVGLVALAFVVAAELSLGALLGRSILDRDPVAGMVFLVSLLVFAALPWAHARNAAGQRLP